MTTSQFQVLFSKGLNHFNSLPWYEKLILCGGALLSGAAFVRGQWILGLLLLGATAGGGYLAFSKQFTDEDCAEFLRSHPWAADIAAKMTAK